MQVTPPGGQRSDLTEGGVDRVLLGHCAQRLLSSREIVLVPLPPAVGRAVDRAVDFRARWPILLNTRGTRLDRHAATRRLRHLAEAADIQTVWVIE